MLNEKLENWAKKLLDTGLRNNLVNFKENKGSLEIISHSGSELFELLDKGVRLEVFDPKKVNDKDFPKTMSREKFIESFKPLLKKNNILAYNKTDANSIRILKNIDKKADTSINETGVNIAYMAIGFMSWLEADSSTLVHKAPLLLVPISIENESAVDPFFISATGDDVVVNPTFDHKLNSEFNVHLPEFDGENVESFFDETEKIAKKLKWTLDRGCWISTFSFLKINMYNDLKEHEEDILENRNVKALFGISDENNDSDGLNSEGQFDDLRDLHTVVDADSSQMKAIKMAKSGKSFVLQGPPGTGKSQTITNIIAECLYDGKKVLFVSEKQAALNVVYDKLRQVGLSDFCLELHSHKSNKRQVIEELCRTLHLPKISASKVTDDMIRRAQSQKVLDQYEHELHCVRPYVNLSLFQMYGAHAHYKNAPQIDFYIDNFEYMNDSCRKEISYMLEKYPSYVLTIGQDYRCNPWNGYLAKDTSIKGKNAIKVDFASMIDALREITPLLRQLVDVYGAKGKTISTLKACIPCLNILNSNEVLVPELFDKGVLSSTRNFVDELASKSEEIIKLRQKITTDFEQKALEIDSDDIHNRLSKLYDTFIKRLISLDYHKTMKQLKLVAKLGVKVNYERALDITQKISTYKQMVLEYEAICSQKKILLGPSYKGIDSNWGHIKESLSELAGYLESVKVIPLPILNYPQNTFNQMIKDAAGLITFAEGFLKKNETLIEKISDDFDKNKVNLVGFEIEPLCKKLESCLSQIDSLENWKAFQEWLAKIDRYQMRGYLDYCIDKSLNPEDYASTFNRRYYDLWIDKILASTPVLSRFNRSAQDKEVDIFAEKDRNSLMINRTIIRVALAQQRPSPNNLVAGSEVAILRHEGEKKRKQMPVRVLIDRIGSTIQKLKPCFLMSPLSVSAFLSTKAVSFDTVIFDEASQVFPEDAIGAIYRGKQVIVVGDSKQMPPSNFFNSSTESDSDDDDYDNVNDYESILDVCSTCFDQLYLMWHYRSRSEQLISFSNRYIYNDRLITFPSSETDKRWVGVDYYFCENGIFSHKSRQNENEAKYIVNLIFENIKQYPKRSLGVVAFSVAQQDLIDTLLYEERQKHPEYEFFFKKDVIEPFFVKNLETVQGDERDTIIFSIAYAKDDTNRLMHNFGPLNKAGGERRLNVAVTRAKYNLQVVASIHGCDIDPKRTSAEGAILLGKYLDYAERGVAALDKVTDVKSDDQFDSVFEEEVCQFLRDNHYDVDTQVGCSGFRIDMGIRKPNSSDYFLAVECDGAAYHSSKNARDRDRLRQEILERMGWNFYRVWSTDWFKNNKTEKRRLLDAVAAAESKPKTKLEESPTVVSDETEIEVDANFSPESSFPKYEKSDVEKIFRSGVNRGSFQKCVRKVLEKEIAVSEESFLKRIVFPCYGQTRVTEKINAKFDEDMLFCNREGILRRKGFIWLDNIEKIPFRIPGDERKIEEIHPQELADGMRTLIKQDGSVDKKSLFQAIAKLLGINRLGSNVNECMEKALRQIGDGFKIEGERICPVKDENEHS